MASETRSRFGAALLAVAALLAKPIVSAPVVSSQGDVDPFAILDPQNWVNPDDMTWDDFVAPPGTNWGDPTRTGSERNFNIALITVDYSDKPFTVTLPAGSTIFGNPLPIVAGIARDTVPSYYRDLLNKPSELNRGHTLHEYWMTDSAGRFGVDLTSFGPYELPAKSYQYGVDTEYFNPGACPAGEVCDIDLRTDALGAWRRDVGNETADSYELVFILSAGQDESSTWQEFGEMRFQTKADVPKEFGPPGNGTNYAKTRYVEWTSWASASTIWPNAGGGSSTQAESSGMSTYAHELSHLLNIGDNYNNPYAIPVRRAYTGPWSMMSRGSFNGPGGPHTRYQIPALQGGSLGSLHTVRDKLQIGLLGNESVIKLSREALSSSGLAVISNITARAVDPGATGLLGVRVQLSADLSPTCNVNTDVYCDGGGYNNYEVEVIDRIGPDSFTPDSGVMISKTKSSPSAPAPFQWTIDANPQDIQLIDFYRPNGTAAYITLGDYRQLADALFHAGTRSGSQYEHTDEANRLQFYVLDLHRDSTGVLSYTVGVRSLDGGAGPSKHGVSLSAGKVTASRNNSPTKNGVTCVFQLRNTGSFAAAATTAAQHPQDVSSFLTSDIYRLSAKVTGSGWRVELPNALATAQFGASALANVAVAAEAKASREAVVTLTAVSESDGSVKAEAECKVRRS